MGTEGAEPKATLALGTATLWRFNGLLRIVSIALLAIVLISSLWIFRAGQIFLSDAHRRNMNALSVAANGLQYWPDSVRGIAVSQLIKANVRPAPPQQALDGWTLALTLRNPDLGAFNISYAFAGRTIQWANPATKHFNSCRDMRNALERVQGTRLPFVDGRSVGAGPMVMVFGSVPLAASRVLDFTTLKTRVSPKEDMAAVMGKAGIRNPEAASDIELCFGAAVATSNLLSFDETSSYFSNFLVVDNAKHVVQQVGEETLPVEGLDQLQQNDATAINPSAFIAAFDGHSASEVPSDKPELSQALAPKTLQIGGRAFVAYVRPFHLPAGLLGCSPSAMPVQTDAASPEKAKTKIREGNELATTTVSEPRSACYLVGLVPRAKLWGDALRATPFFIITFVLINGLVVCAFPIVRLLSMGPNESLPRYNLPLIVGAAIIGLSLITIALLTWTDMTFERERMLAEAKTTTRLITEQAGRDLTEMIRDGLLYRDGTEGPTPRRVMASSAREMLNVTPVNDEAKFSKKSLAKAGGLIAVEGAESIVHLAINGIPTACQVPAIYTHAVGTNRFEVSGRAYFKNFSSGHFDGVFTTRGTETRSPPGQLRYVVDQVRDQTDGVNKAVVLVEAPDPDGAMPVGDQKDDQSPCWTAGYIITGVLGSLVSPVLPDGMEMMVVDTHDPTLPVKFDSRPERIGVEQLAHEIGSRPLRQLRNFLNYSAAQQTVSESFAFRAVNDGNERQFVARSIPQTPWVVMISYPMADVDRLPVNRAERAIVSGTTLGLVLLLLWWFSALLYPQIARNLWPHEKIGSDDRDHRLFGALSYGVVSFVLCGLIVGEAFALLLPSPYGIYGIAALATAAVGTLYVQSHSPRRVAGTLSPANERAFERLAILFLCCVTIVPTITIWRDARHYVDAQQRLRMAVAFSGPGGAMDQHRNALDEIARSWFPGDKAVWGGDAKTVFCDLHVFVGSDPKRCQDETATVTSSLPNTFYQRWFSERLDRASLPATLASQYPACRDRSPPIKMGDEFCISHDRNGATIFGYSSDHRWRDLARFDLNATFLILMPLMLITVGSAIWRILRMCLLALFGFGVPLGIDVRRPPVYDPRFPLRNTFPSIDERIARAGQDLSPDEAKALRCLVLEIIPLPRPILSEVLPKSAIDLDPVSTQDAVFEDELDGILAWATRVKAPSCVEAVDYLKCLLTPSYQAIWKALDVPERIDLHHLASRRIINVGRAASVVASLLRKGLIVMDPAPRLMNESFAAFVRQVAPRSTIRDWAKTEGLSPWGTSKLPLLIGIPTLIVSTALIFFWADLDASAILPIFATGIPALITMVQKMKPPKET